MKDLLEDHSTLSTAKSGTLRLYGDVLKRPLDLVLVLAMLPVVLPVIAILWLAVRTDGAPGFYRQERIGRHGRRFACLKLRTMIPDADAARTALCRADPAIAFEWHLHQKLANDPRITPLGHLLRQTSLDELPQIWNVVKGDMSVVGPRPFTVEQEGMYVAAGGSGYFDLRPGITGPWQVGARGQTGFLERIAFDEAYARRCSLGHDLAILFRTACVIWRRTGR